MPRANPSKVLSLQEVDDAVDLIMKGLKYCSPKENARFPTPKIAMQLNLDGRDWSAVQSYVIQRWSMSQTGATRRTNTLQRKVIILAEKLVHDNDLVWRVGSYSGTMGYVCAPTNEAARQIGWTMFGPAWLDDPKAVSPNALYTERISAGGWREAATMNTQLVNQLRSSINERLASIKNIQSRIERDEHRAAAVMAAIMLGGPDEDSPVDDEVADDV